ncbi:sugar-binding transcriptional regulator [Candidatus Enterococcus mansonii]|uniref:SorC family transcriptional regulator n=1 Tax=Candidatus Enterococcus mansonii TaxID=1834181 RepID=A0A242CI91_9ENTE|nr:sugar-binding domain-containing protein [Enterococcus sp. 4G2_DIV0659]OTO09879.1 SorC family transcriptional regulator [Enterococcus sp. 4G2_DIV0659]
MLDELKMIEAVAPDLLDVMQERFHILRNIYWMQPIGRRSLSDSMGITERVLRTETDFLKNLQLIETSKSGMTLTEKGLDVYQGLESVMNQLLGMHQIEKEISQYFGIKRCIVVAGNSDIQEKVLYEFGDVLTDSLDLLLPEGENIIAVMGGTTMAMTAEHMGTLETEKRHNLFVPARGGIGEAMTVQANSVSAVMASKTGGHHRALYVPEQLSLETYNSLLQEPSIQEVLSLIEQSNCVVHSIGRALHMAARRKMSDDELIMLKQNNAVAESFGYFFDEEGEVVYKIPRIGLQLKDVQKIPNVVAIAGGKTKAKAIHAYMKNAPKQTWLITDEAAANEILKGATL